jgi:predicted dehydrogenase
LLRWFLGAEFAEVYAEVGRGLLHEGTPIDDAGLLSFRLTSGVYGTLDTSWSRPASYPTWGNVKLEILGERGLLRADIFRQHLTLTSDVTGTVSHLGWGSNADLGLIRSFVHTVRTGAPPAITGEDGLRALEVALAAYRSAETGEVEKLSAISRQPSAKSV